MRLVVHAVALVWLMAAAPPAVAQKAAPIELKAKLVDIPSKFPPDDLYDYAYVVKYEAIGGKLDKQPLLVAHYKPRQPRDKIDGKMKKHVAGKLKRFRKGDLHQLKIVPMSRKIWKGALVDDYFAKDRKTKRYWCKQVDLAKN